eukprot:scaffold1724_cov341-Pavlova_lutheri.AAC.5
MGLYEWVVGRDTKKRQPHSTVRDLSRHRNINAQTALDAVFPDGPLQATAACRNPKANTLSSSQHMLWTPQGFELEHEKCLSPPAIHWTQEVRQRSNSIYKQTTVHTWPRLQTHGTARDTKEGIESRKDLFLLRPACETHLRDVSEQIAKLGEHMFSSN